MDARIAAAVPAVPSSDGSLSPPVPVTSSGHGDLGRPFVTLSARQLQRQGRVATQGPTLLLAVQAVPVVLEHSAGGEHLQHQAPFIGDGVALGFRLQRLDGCIGEWHSGSVYTGLTIQEYTPKVSADVYAQHLGFG
jgi:hypothetical protein